jgi:hypothetical protein
VLAGVVVLAVAEPGADRPVESRGRADGHGSTDDQESTCGERREDALRTVSHFRGLLISVRDHPDRR